MEKVELEMAMLGIGMALRPDPLTRRLEFTDILHYLTNHPEDPNVQRFFSLSLKHDVRDEERRMTTDERPADKFKLPKPVRKVPEGPPQKSFQIFCFVREGPGTPSNGGENSRYAEEFIGTPTAKQIEDYLKKCMACPVEGFPPQIPENVCFSNNLMQYATALRPFLSTLPMRYVFEPVELRELFLEEGYAEGAQMFRRSIEMATSVKERGNEAFANHDRVAAVALYEAAVEDVEKLLLKGMSHEEDRKLEAKSLLAVCWANCAAARMLEIPGYGCDLEGAKANAESAIAADPGYAKGYIRLSRAHELLGNMSAAKDALARGLRQKGLKNNFGLADHLILLQTNKKGLPPEKGDFQRWFKNVIEDLGSDLGGAWKMRCRMHGVQVGVAV
ncbi:hypothetical protein M413DRAFT_440461 [Hebeloma cylindrosporum]|uniref:Uncharacterized protein n=1 Tax=Hebeloma cylindrosporum TaxID=76867 RepID=A0A0C3CS29_HEBCY|nr:hypothetical protein M413DRAFT_440461 [Hebeloma cylindrosporum h7]